MKFIIELVVKASKNDTKNDYDLPFMVLFFSEVSTNTLIDWWEMNSSMQTNINDPISCNIYVCVSELAEKDI